MVIKGKSRSGATALASHLLRTDTNETVEVLEIVGVAASDVLGALHEMEAVSKGARTTKAFYHASISPAPGYDLTAAQKLRAVEELGKALKLKNQPRVVVQHVKEGRLHLHVVWSRINLDRMAAIPDSHNFRKHEEVSRALEREFGHRRVEGVHVEREGRPRPRRTASRAETQQTERTGIELKGMTAEVTAIWKATPTGQAFADALGARGYILARGDRRDFVIVDHAGGAHSLARRVEGATAASVRTRMADINPATLPTVAEARAMQLLRQPDRPAPRPRRSRIEVTSQRPVATRRSSERHRKTTASIPGTPPPSAGSGEQPEIPFWFAGLPVTVAFRAAPRAEQGTLRHDYRSAARSVCGSLRGILPLAGRGRGGGDERLPRERHGRVVQQRRVQSRRTRARATAEPEGMVSGLMASIAADISARGAMASAGIRAEFAHRMSGVCRSVPEDQVEGALAALRSELDAILNAIAEATSAEIRGKQEAVSQLHAGKKPPPESADHYDDATTAVRPVYGFEAQPRRLAS